MYILDSHPLHTHALDSTGKYTLNIVESRYLSAQYRFIQNEIIKNLELGKTNLFVIPDHLNSDIVPKLLANFKLAKLVLLIEADSSFTDKQIAQIKALSKVEKRQYNPKNYEVSKANAHKTLQKIKSNYHLLNRPIFGNRSWNFIATNNNFYSLREEVSLLTQKLKDYQFQFNQSEYWLVRGRIEEAMKLYNPEFRFLESSDKIKIEKLADNGVKPALDKLSEFSRRCQKLNYRFSKFIEDYSRQFYHEGLQEIEKINKKLEFLSEKLNEYEVRFGKTFDRQVGLQEKIKIRFSTTFKEEIDARKELRDLTQDLAQTFTDSQKYNLDISSVFPEDIQLTYIKEVISKASHKIDHWRNAVTKYKNHSLKQVNLLNNDRTELKEMDREFQQLILDLNQSQLFKEQFEDNTFNILKKIDFVSEVKYTVNQAFWLISNYPDYIRWRIVSEHYPVEVTHFIQGLKNFQKNRWILLFDRFYIEQITKQNFHPNIPNNFSNLELFTKRCDSYRKEILHWVEYLWEKKRQNVLENLQNNAKQFHANLFKKNNSPDFSIRKVLVSNTKFLKTYFPVIVMKESMLREISGQMSKEWDVVWMLTDQDSPPFEFSSLKTLGNKFIYLKNGNVEESDVRKICAVNEQNSFCHHILSVDYEELITPFTLLQKSEVLKTAKRISSRLSFASESQRIFQLKDKSIISYLSDRNNEKLIQLLDSHGIKEIVHRSKGELDLVDVLVNLEKEIIILTQDGMFDYENVDSAEWQYRQLALLQNLGVKWINVWTSSYYYEEGDVLQRALNSIMNLDQKEKEKLVDAQ